MTAESLLDRLVAIVARFNRRYERPHAVVEARDLLIAELTSAGFRVGSLSAMPGNPYRQRLTVEPGPFNIQGAIDIPNGLIRLEVTPSDG